MCYSLCIRVGCWQEERVRRGWTAHVGADWPLWLLVTLTVGSPCSNCIKSARHPGKRKGTTSETTVGSHSGQLFSYHGNPPLETASVSRKYLQTISINEKRYTAASKLYSLLDLVRFSALRRQAQVHEHGRKLPSAWLQA